MLLPCEQRTVRIYDRCSPSVGAVLSPPSTGTCFVWDSYTLLTCLHTLQNSSNPTISLPCGTSVTASISSTCPTHDVAVLRTATPLPAAPLPCSQAAARSGQLAFALVGFPESPPSLTAGVVSAVGRSAPAPECGGPALTGLVQVDAFVNNGASGAPLLDSDGRLLGMVCAIASESGRFEGVAYAVPVAVLKRFVGQRRARI